jgi:hypothetical protein
MLYLSNSLTMYTNRMKFILLAIGGFILLLIINSFLGGDPLG